MAKRRGRRRGVWFPTLGTIGSGEVADDDDAGIFGQITIVGTDSEESSVFLTDLTFDKPIEDELDSTVPEGRSMADIIGSEYILRRIVGKLFIGLDASAPNQAGPLGALCTAGFFVARAEDSSTEGAGQGLPIGSETLVERRENYSPAAVSTIREPWIWRRKWILGNKGREAGNVFGGLIVPQVANYPPTTAQYGSVMDGPHIDAQTVRRVSQDDRLFFALAVRALGADFLNPFGSADFTLPLNIGFHLDYRLFGMLTKAKNRGAF